MQIDHTYVGTYYSLCVHCALYTYDGFRRKHYLSSFSIIFEIFYDIMLGKCISINNNSNICDVVLCIYSYTILYDCYSYNDNVS